jgi:hypothetical protein
MTADIKLSKHQLVLQPLRVDPGNLDCGAGWGVVPACPLELSWADHVTSLRLCQPKNFSAFTT